MFEQLKLQNDSFIYRLMFLTAFLLSLWVGNSAHAEQTVNQYIQSTGLIPVAGSGSPTIPLSIVGTIASGELPPALLYVYTNQLLISAVKKAKESPPDYRSPINVALAKFNASKCILLKVFQNNMVLTDLPLIAARGGSDSDPNAINARAIFQALLGMATKSDEQAGCDSSNPDDSGIAVGILQFFGLPS